MTQCDRCSTDVEKTFWHERYPNGICGCCEVTLARRFPGVSGFDSVSQMHPDFHDEDKAARGLLKTLRNSKNPKNNPSSDQANLIMAVARKDKLEREAHEARLGKRGLEKQAAQVREHEQQVNSTIQQEQTAARRELREANRTWARYKQAMGIGA